MEEFTNNLRGRVQELGLSFAEVARRCGLPERRFANYAAGAREPDLATLVKIAETLATTPDALLGLAPTASSAPDERTKLRQQLAADAHPLDTKSLKLAVDLVRTVVEHHRSGATKRR